jgi:integrase
MSKRSHGEGSLCHRSNGTWLAQVSIEGKRVSKTFRLRKDAQEWLTNTTGQVRQGLTYSSTKTTVDELLTEWLSIKKTNSRPATSEQYGRTARLYILPNFGALKLQEISPAKIQKLYAKLENEKIGRRTIEIVHTVLHGFLSHADKLGLITKNWASSVEVPRPVKREMSVWSESQVSQFLMTVPNDPFYRLAFATGMRRGELIGLQWKDIDWKTGMLKIQHQVFELEGGGFVFQAPKTDRGRRKIRLGPGLLESLKKHYQETIPLMQAIAGTDWIEYDLVFPNAKGKPRYGYAVTMGFEKQAELSGLPVIRFHDIRHTAASLMLLHGEPPVRVAGILGQGVGILLNTYAHYIQDDQEKASKIMDDITTVTQIDLSDCNRLQPNEDILSSQMVENVKKR